MPQVASSSRSSKRSKVSRRYRFMTNTFSRMIAKPAPLCSSLSLLQIFIQKYSRLLRPDLFGTFAGSTPAGRIRIPTLHHLPHHIGQGNLCFIAADMIDLRPTGHEFIDDQWIPLGAGAG